MSKTHNGFIWLTKNIIKKIFFVIFYNTNFFINLADIFEYLAPLFVVGLFFKYDITIQIILNYLVISVVVLFVYNLVYIYNDWFDRESDLIFRIYKNNIRSVLGVKNYWPIYLFFLAIILLFVFTFYKIIFLSVILLISILLTFSFLHTRYKRIKFITIFIERFLRVAAPFYFLATIYNSNYTFFVLFVVSYLFPISGDICYIRYLTKKLNWDKDKLRLRFLIYFFYYLVLIAILMNSNFLLRSNFINLLFIFVLSFLIISLISKNVGRSIKVDIIDQNFDTEESILRKRIIASFLLNGLVIIGITLWIIIF